MITLMNDLPDHIMSIKASGVVTAADYENILIPALEEKLKHHDKVSFLYQITEDFESFEAHALWDDFKEGMKHVTSWEKMACVTDNSLLASSLKIAALLSFGHLKVYKNSELELARAWLCEE